MAPFQSHIPDRLTTGVPPHINTVRSALLKVPDGTYTYTASKTPTTMWIVRVIIRRVVVVMAFQLLRLSVSLSSCRIRMTVSTSACMVWGMATNPTYYDGDLRADLLAAAIEAIAQSGPAAVSLRSVAKSVGVSHAAPQNHFGDKAGLFAAVAVDGFERLGAELAARPEEEALDRLAMLGVGYVRCALENPAHFSVMWDPDLHHDPPEVQSARAVTFAMLLEALDDAEGSLSETAALARAERAWATAHGFAALLLSGSLAPPPETSPLQYVAEQLDHVDVG